MKEFIDVGAAPTCEDCAQVGSPDYRHRAERECRAFVALLHRTLGPEPEGAHLGVKSSPHDFGAYLSVVCYYDDRAPDAIDYAFRCESNTPEHRDLQALREMAGRERR